jgi:hypothetical protein
MGHRFANGPAQSGRAGKLALFNLSLHSRRMLSGNDYPLSLQEMKL